MEWKVTVYYFTALDASSGEDKRSERRATPDRIKAVKGTPIPESALEVDISEIDQDGFWTVTTK